MKNFTDDNIRTLVGNMSSTISTEPSNIINVDEFIEYLRDNNFIVKQ